MSARVCFTGDVMSHLGLVLLEHEGQPFAGHFTPGVRALCRAHHEVWGNLEGPVARGDDGLAVHAEAAATRPGVAKLFFLPRNLETLAGLGFTVLSVANNHAFDFERATDTEESADRIRQAGMLAPGLSFDPVVRELGGLSFAVFATTCHVNAPGPIGPVAFLSRDTLPRLLDEVSRWRREVDYVVVLTHWGRDYEAFPRASIRELARALLAGGVNVVYGNHPHILWEIEQPRPDQLVCFSLGNFTQLIGCARTHPQYPVYREALYGGLLSVEFTRSGISALFHPTEHVHNYDEWLAQAGPRSTYWLWGEREIARWLNGLPERRTRLSARVALRGAAIPLPHTAGEAKAVRSGGDETAGAPEWAAAAA